MDEEKWQYTIYNPVIVGQTSEFEVAQEKALEINGVIAMAVWAPTLFSGLPDSTKCQKCGGRHGTW